MYLVDTNVLSEGRRGTRAHPGVRAFLAACRETPDLYVASITIGEIQQGVEMVRRRGDATGAARLGSWLDLLLSEFDAHVLAFGTEEARVWGRLRARDPQNAVDKQIAAIALVHDLTVVTRNAAHFEGLGVRVLDPAAPNRGPRTN